ncbi:MAG: 50S ribosomal protein L29 [bacterium ADurb.Bin425]|nr:MAG: 50S ribosomal protein L29 [bacterium ADurb.Bin425]
MKVKELRELSKEELTGRIDEARKSLVELRFQLAMRKLENPARIRTTKRELAQMLTIMTEKDAVKG